MSNQDKGRRGETLAAAYLARRGFRILERNYRRLRCEVDIIAMDGEILAFVEVKARYSGSMGLGRDALTAAKRRNIIKAAQCYIQERGLQDTAARFDVAEVGLEDGRVTYIENAFEV